MKLLQNKEIAGVNPAAIIDKDGSVLIDYETTIKENDPMDRLDAMLKDGPAWDHLDEMLGE
jgi:hypothetical protein